VLQRSLQNLPLMAVNLWLPIPLWRLSHDPARIQIENCR
jgi:hypothetical protein